ncbi:serine-rich adhesin for platelets isoform X3 [Drosophila tropicalis]|uniref:serine-rich adhesin for platelets isoform X3 n=1 Tax=Drosophila tropicalis TaxID=46794 RepID=UPI0035AB98C8
MAFTSTGANDDYITVVEVDDPTSSTKDTNQLKNQLVKRQSSVAEDSSFITVLTINEMELLQQQHEQQQKQQQEVPQNLDESENVILYRLPGERLGFGLKFQGGTRNTELVQKLYIQSCAADSPASKVATSWGHLREGDEILNIDGHDVSQMTRIDCVRCLKDNVAIKLIVRNGHGQKPPSEEEQQQQQQQQNQQMEQLSITLNAQPPPPPPVPPRKLQVKRQNSREQQPNNQLVQLVIEKPLTPPPDAEYYINLLTESIKAESESDDTASTISTVIDKFSMGSDTELVASSLNGHDLAKVLKPFTLLEEEFQLEQQQQQQQQPPKLIIPGNNYENVEFKTEKINVYENVELAKSPIPKPRIQLATVEPKKRSIIPMPRKIATINSNNSSNKSLPIEVAPPRIPTVNTPPATPTDVVKESNVTKIPKASMNFSRAKTEGEIKLQLTPTNSSKMQSPQQTKSRIPIVSTPTQKSPSTPTSTTTPTTTTTTMMSKSLLTNSPPLANSNIPRLLQKQKSETDLKLGFYRNSKSKESSPTALGQLRPPLQRANSAEAPARTPERTFIPVLLLNGSNNNNSKSSTESLSSTCSSSSGTNNNGRSPKGPKPKPPERVQSLQKTQIPKLQLLPTTPPQQQPKLTMQTFKQQQQQQQHTSNLSNGTAVGLPATPKTTPVNTPSPTSNREIRFKIQTYESKTLEEDKMPSLFDLVHKQDKDKANDNVATDITALLAAAAAEAEDLARESPPPLVVGKCMKVVDDTQNTTCYSSSSSDCADDDTGDDDVDDAAEREYICEDGEKLGPPELINGPGPSEAYFNMYWHSNMLPTIGEVEEEFSSLEPQSLTNGTVVKAEKLPQQPQQQQQQLLMSKMEANEENDKIIDHDAADKSLDQTLTNSSTSTKTIQEESVSESSVKSQRSSTTTTTKVTTMKTSSSSSSSSTSTSTSSSSNVLIPDIAFKLQPYEERQGDGGENEPTMTTTKTTTTVHEERRVMSEEQTLSALRTTDPLTGEEKLLTNVATKSNSARFKKISSNDNLLDLGDEQLQPLTATVSAEMRLTERLDNPQDKQSIETGILTLSECGKQLQLAENGNGLTYTECEEINQETYLEGEQILNGNDNDRQEQDEDGAALVTFERELSETLTETKDGEKQVTKKLEQSKESAAKKGAKLLKKTDEERRLEQEAQKLIESYQKVKKEAEKLYNLELADDEQGFDLSAFEEKEKKESHDVQEREPAVEFYEEHKKEIKKVEEQEVTVKVEEDLGYVLHKHIIEDANKLEHTSAPTPAPKPKHKPPVPTNKPKLSPPSPPMKPKVAPPPVPTKRSEKPTPTQRRSSLELSQPPKPLERIIVGVEQPIITLASVDLPNVPQQTEEAMNGAAVEVTASVTPVVAAAVVVAASTGPVDEIATAEASLSTSGDEALDPNDLHFESHQLPNAEKQTPKGAILSTSSSTGSSSSTMSETTTPITTPILVSATSSMDSVKSVIEVTTDSQKQHDDQDDDENDDDDDNDDNNGEEVHAVSELNTAEDDVSTLSPNREHEAGECLAIAFHFSFWVSLLTFL